MKEIGTRSLGFSTLAVVMALALGSLTLAACGDDDDGDATAASGSGDSVTSESIDGTDVLVDADGRALYTADQEADGNIVCSTASCLEIWDPVLVSELTDGVESLGTDFGTVKRPDGDRQLTLNGGPLYSFTEEGPGELTGNGLVDSFDGTEFTWTAATSGGQPASGESDSDSSGGGAYGY